MYTHIHIYYIHIHIHTHYLPTVLEVFELPIGILDYEP